MKLFSKILNSFLSLILSLSLDIIPNFIFYPQLSFIIPKKYWILFLSSFLTPNTFAPKIVVVPKYQTRRRGFDTIETNLVLWYQIRTDPYSQIFTLEQIISDLFLLPQLLRNHQSFSRWSCEIFLSDRVDHWTIISVFSESSYQKEKFDLGLEYGPTLSILFHKVILTYFWVWFQCDKFCT